MHLSVVVEHPVEAAFRDDIQPLIGKGWHDLLWWQCGVLLLVAGQRDALALLIAQLVREQAWTAFTTIVTKAITEHGLPPAIEGAQADANLAAGADQSRTSGMCL